MKNTMWTLNINYTEDEEYFVKALKSYSKQEFMEARYHIEASIFFARHNPKIEYYFLSYLIRKKAEPLLDGYFLISSLLREINKVLSAKEIPEFLADQLIDLIQMRCYEKLSNVCDQVLMQGLMEEPKKITILYIKLLALIEMGNIAESIKTCNTILTLDPNQRSAIIVYQWLLIKFVRKDGSIYKEQDQLEYKVLEEKIKPLEFIVESKDEALSESKEDTLQDYLEELEIEARFLTFYCDEQYLDALKILDELISRKPDAAKYYALKYLLLKNKLKDLAQTARWLDIIHQSSLDNDTIDWYIAIAQELYSHFDYDAAVEMCQSVLLIDPDNQEVWNIIKNSYLNLLDYALNINPNQEKLNKIFWQLTGQKFEGGLLTEYNKTGEVTLTEKRILRSLSSLLSNKTRDFEEKIFKNNTSVTELDISNSNICLGDIKMLLTMLDENDTLQIIHFPKFDPAWGYLIPHIKASLKLNRLIFNRKQNSRGCTHLELIDLGINDTAVFALIRKLKKNWHFLSLDLSNNHTIAGEGLTALADYLAENPPLLSLKLDGIWFSDQNALKLLEALKKNSNLQELTLSKEINPVIHNQIKQLLLVRKKINAESENEQEDNEIKEKINILALRDEELKNLSRDFLIDIKNFEKNEIVIPLSLTGNTDAVVQKSAIGEKGKQLLMDIPRMYSSQQLLLFNGKPVNADVIREVLILSNKRTKLKCSASDVINEILQDEKSALYALGKDLTMPIMQQVIEWFNQKFVYIGNMLVMTVAYLKNCSILISEPIVKPKVVVSNMEKNRQNSLQFTTWSSGFDCLCADEKGELTSSNFLQDTQLVLRFNLSPDQQAFIPRVLVRDSNLAKNIFKAFCKRRLDFYSGMQTNTFGKFFTTKPNDQNRTQTKSLNDFLVTVYSNMILTFPERADFLDQLEKMSLLPNREESADTYLATEYIKTALQSNDDINQNIELNSENSIIFNK